MHRTQIYLQDNLHARLKTRAKSIGVSISELIRRTLEQEIKTDPLADAAAFFARLQPLTGFTDPANAELQSPEAYVRGLRAKSRILRATQQAADSNAP